jgi:uncharacterized membrane protein
MNSWFTNDAVVLGLLFLILAFVFSTSNSKNKFWQKFYKFIPPLLLCYFIPGILNSIGIISADSSQLYFVASRYFLPVSLVLLTLSIDLKAILKLGPKALIMTFTATVSIIIGGPFAILVVKSFAPEIVGGSGADEVWRGLATIAGSWIGGGANQTAMKEIFGASDNLFSAIIAVDVIAYSIWMAVLLYGAGVTEKIDKYLNADTSSIDDVKGKIEQYHKSIIRIPTLADLMKIMAVAFGITGLSHFLGDIIAPYFQSNFPETAKFSLTSSFFWIVLLATTGGFLLSFTKAKELEGAGASKIGSLFLYILIASIGMSMDIFAFFDNPGLLLIAVIWILFHAVIMIAVGKLIKAPLFFIAVGSQANIGGAASAPIVASAFHPSLATVGVILAVLGYAVGTYGAWISAILMSYVSP